MNKQLFISIAKIAGVVFALYLFLVGINGLSSGIKHLTQPDVVEVGDMVQNKAKIDGINKKVWMLVEDINYNEDGQLVYRCDYKVEGISEKFDVQESKVKMVASSTFVNTTSSSILALFIGIFATVLFQSSSTTTSLIVGMVSSGVVSLTASIPMIMGANIGTTVTNTLVSIGHIRRGNEFKRAFAASTVHDFFNLMAVIIMFPLEMSTHFIERSATAMGIFFFGRVSTEDAFKSPIKAAIKWGSSHVESLSGGNDILYIIISVVITFFMLYFIVKLLRSLVLEKVETFFDQYIFKTPLRGIIFGMILTIMVQSSSITTSTIVPLAGAGVLSLRQIYPFTLGANIGTTVTALLASLTLNVTAMVAAFTHLLFNLYSIVLIYMNPLLRDIPIKLANGIAELSVRNKFYPFIYLFIVFFLIPFFIIFFGR
ncbi:MAG: Na/Pi symporter [Candidatus Marinimicrobia bacterium]|nr:Na/Pi symporter [Candidatus Neomarinimicrobiota bacterium]MBT7377331.1 Na/Pi symporter [Candidatus Neomarinimicrobiota bacterium]